MVLLGRWPHLSGLDPAGALRQGVSYVCKNRHVSILWFIYWVLKQFYCKVRVSFINNKFNVAIFCNLNYNHTMMTMMMMICFFGMKNGRGVSSKENFLVLTGVYPSTLADLRFCIKNWVSTTKGLKATCERTLALQMGRYEYHLWVPEANLLKSFAIFVPQLVQVGYLWHVFKVILSAIFCAFTFHFLCVCVFFCFVVVVVVVVVLHFLWRCHYELL